MHLRVGVAKNGDRQDAVRLEARLLVNLLIESAVRVGIRNVDQLALGAAQPSDACLPWNADLLARVCGNRPELVVWLVHEEDRGSLCTNDLVRVHCDGQQHGLRAKVLRKALDGIEQARCTLTAGYGIPVHLRIPHRNTHVLGKVLQDLLVVAPERHSPARLLLDIAKILRHLVDGLDDAHTGAIKVHEGHRQQAPGGVARLAVEGRVEATVLIAVRYIHRLLRHEDAAYDALAKFCDDGPLEVRSI
mmetsp:Transcript_20865/g.58894  ORF Transcript_20865/g.58894 Transcript_20865/m.58894 type:complete len:247 (-) Transcript_20865:431-1171(-)